VAEAADFDATEAAELYMEHRSHLDKEGQALDDRLQARAK
jgi:hypothetical protein